MHIIIELIYDALLSNICFFCQMSISCRQYTVYKFSIFYKHANPNNQPYYYIITFTQYTKNIFDWDEGKLTHVIYMIVC
jgi:hypothetical protein